MHLGYHNTQGFIQDFELGGGGGGGGGTPKFGVDAEGVL